MSDGSHDPVDRAGIGPTEYRTRLLTKLNCLIAVIEVAIAKVDRGLESPTTNEERLQRVRANLENTLAICKRAKNTLQKGAGAPAKQVRIDRPHMSYRDYVELSSIEEYRKFKALPPIRRQELSGVDLDDLLRKLADS